jgi:hypothetical protein
MGTLQWREHFRGSVKRDRGIDWSHGIRLRADVRDPLIRSLQTFQRGMTSPGVDLRTKIRRAGDAEFADCIDLYVQEKNIHSELLMRLLWEAGSEPARRAAIDFLFRRFRRRFDWVRELSIIATAEMVAIPFFRAVANSVDCPLTRQVLESILADLAYDLGFHIDHLRNELERRPSFERLAVQQAWSAFFASMLGVVMVDNRDVFRALRYDPLAFWTDAWNLFAQVQTGLVGSHHLASVLGRDPRIKFAI